LKKFRREEEVEVIVVWVQLDQQGFKVLLDQLEHEEQLDHKDYKAQQGSKVLLDQLEHEEQLDHRG
jgi:aromatic ring-cleaving dioxygenase